MSVNGHTRVIACDICEHEHAVTRLADGSGVCRSCADLLQRPSPHPFSSRRGRALWFWGQYRNYEALPLWYVAREWVRCELRRKRG